MDKANYEKALVKEDDSTIVEHAITKDGEEYFSYYGSGIYGSNETNVARKKPIRTNAKVQAPGGRRTANISP